MRRPDQINKKFWPLRRKLTLTERTLISLMSGRYPSWERIRRAYIGWFSEDLVLPFDAEIATEWSDAWSGCCGVRRGGQLSELVVRRGLPATITSCPIPSEALPAPDHRVYLPPGPPNQGSSSVLSAKLGFGIEAGAAISAGKADELAWRLGWTDLGHFKILLTQAEWCRRGEVVLWTASATMLSNPDYDHFCFGGTEAWWTYWAIVPGRPDEVYVVAEGGDDRRFMGWAEWEEWVTNLLQDGSRE